MLLLLLGWILPTALCYYVALNRNRNAGKALLVGLLLGWIGLAFLAVCLRPRDLRTGFLY